jgi:stage II sporulation protein D
VTEGRHATAQGRRYRGRLGVFRDPAGLTLVNRLALESYVAGVIGAEMGRRRPDEMQALRAQAVVSRSFALRNRGRWESLGFDVYGDTRDQAYVGVEAESPSTWDAVRATTGEVLRHRGEVIEAFFHSTCGYSTAGAEEAFRTGRRLPYLRPVSDRRDGGGYYCEISPRFRWREEWDASTLRTILSRTLPEAGGGGLQPIVDLSVGSTTRSGRVAELLIRFARGEARVSGAEVRRILRPEANRHLGSTAFQVQVTKSGGEVTRVVAVGAGWGHGVGLCQWGAVGRARAGQDYRRILATYFPETTLERLY